MAAKILQKLGIPQDQSTEPEVATSVHELITDIDQEGEQLNTRLTQIEELL